MLEVMAAVARAPHSEMKLEPIFLDDPRANELLVEVRAVGVCHTDLSARDQAIPLPLPAVLGHEGAGIVKAVGADVTTARVGDRVVMSQAFCGKCDRCASGRVTACRLATVLSISGVRADGTPSMRDRHGHPLSGCFLGQSSFATHALVREPNVVRLPEDVPWEIAAPLACGAQTGAGTILNTLKPTPTSSVAIFGAGTVGLSAVMAAAYVRCANVIVVDPHLGRLQLATELGATRTIDPRSGDPVAEIRELTGEGVDFSVEASGALPAGPAAVASLHSQGTCVLLGAPAFGTKIELDWIGLVSGRTVLGAVYGGGKPTTSITRLLEIWAAGAFPLERLVRTYPFGEIERAIKDMESGTVVKPVLLAP